jgi:hypothetical protein
MSKKVVTIKKINDVQVKPVKTSLEMDSRPVLGEQIFADPTANILMIAHKGSGKTSTISTILKKCCSPNQSVIVIGSTVMQDPVWIAIRKWCKKHSIPFMGITSIKDPANGADFFKIFLKKLQEEGQEKRLSDDEEEATPVDVDPADQDPPKYPNFFAGNGRYDEDNGSDDSYEYSESEEEEPLVKQGKIEPVPFKFPKTRESSLKERSKYKEPDYTIILDDLSAELKTPSLGNFLKYCRHFRCRMLTSTQYSKDFLPSSISQQDYILLYPGLDEARLLKLSRDVGLTVPFDVFIKLYRDATKQKYNFLWWDTRNNAFRKNFDKQYFVTSDKDDN